MRPRESTWTWSAMRRASGQVLLDQQDRQALALEALDHPADLADEQRRQTLRRLVHQEQVGVGHQRAGDGQHLLLAAGELARRGSPRARGGAGTAP